MTNLRQVCVNIDQEQEEILEALASAHGIDVPRYLQGLISTHTREAAADKRHSFGREKRVFPRKEVSILGVSCVTFSDTEMRSYPVVIEDISRGGLRISFRATTPDITEKLAFADFFEVVFTVPETTQTVSFYCKRMWANVKDNLSLSGCFEGNHKSAIDLVSRLVLNAN